MTALVGPNNAGKSYMAMLMYSALHLHTYHSRGRLWSFSPVSGPILDSRQVRRPPKGAVKAFAAWFEEADKSTSGPAPRIDEAVLTICRSLDLVGA